jgi:hypothetical protein
VAALRQQLKKILDAPENAGLVAEIKEILAEAQDKSAGGAKFHVPVKDSQVGVIGDYGNATMNIGSKPKE